MSNYEHLKLFWVLRTLPRKYRVTLYSMLTIYVLLRSVFILTYKNQNCASQHVLKHMQFPYSKEGT